jgi:hypothetical protein
MGNLRTIALVAGLCVAVLAVTMPREPSPRPRLFHPHLARGSSGDRPALARPSAQRLRYERAVRGAPSPAETVASETIPPSEVPEADEEAPKAQCHGRLVYDDGEPVPTMVVSIWSPVAFAAVLCDADGRFRIEPVALASPTRFSLRIGPPGQEQPIVDVELRPDEDVEVNATADRGFGANVLVVDETTSEPIPAASMSLVEPGLASKDAGGESLASASSNGNGYVFFRHLLRDRYAFVVTAAGYDWLDGTMLFDRRPTDTTRLSLRRGVRLAIRFEGWAPERLVGARLELTSHDLERTFPIDVPMPDMAREANFEFESVAPRAGSYDVALRSSDGTWRVKDFVVPDSGTAELVLARPPTVAISGRLVDGGGSPVVVSRLGWIREDGLELRGFVSPDGAFSVDVPVGSYRIEASLDDGATSRIVDRFTVDADVRDEVVFRVDESVVRVRVAACPWRCVILQRLDRAGWVDRGFRIGDSMPTYELQLEPGRWRLAAGVFDPRTRQPRETGPATEFDVVPGQPVPDVDLASDR